MNIAVFGGSFNPIHNGHLAIAKAALRCADIDAVWLMVSPQNPFKEQHDLMEDNLRLRLARQGVAEEKVKNVVVSDFEFHLPRPSYTADTLDALASSWPEHDFSLLMGADNWLTFRHWHRHEHILASFPIIIYPRDGACIDPESLPLSVTLIDMPLFNISSTDIRRRLASGESIAALVPKSVSEELKSNGGAL